MSLRGGHPEVLAYLHEPFHLTYDAAARHVELSWDK